MRKTMTTGSKTITFHYDENKNVTHETDGNNQVVASYIYADNQPISMTRGGKTYYYQTNYRGDVVALTDSAGAVVATYEYDAYGNLLKETGNVENPYRYAGYRYDKETGLYYLQSRYYNPETGRFLTRDAFEGVDTEPISLSKYPYAHNNPVKHIDPSGYIIPLLAMQVVRLALRRVAIAAGLGIANAVYGQTSKYGFSTRKWNLRKMAQDFTFYFLISLLPGSGIKHLRTLSQATYVTLSSSVRSHSYRLFVWLWKNGWLKRYNSAKSLINSTKGTAVKRISPVVKKIINRIRRR